MITVDRDTLHQLIDELPDDILAELASFVEFLQFRCQQDERARLDTQIHYSQFIPSRQLREQLARDYDELAAMYNELAGELADEVWLPLENEALSRTEGLTE